MVDFISSYRGGLSEIFRGGVGGDELPAVAGGVDEALDGGEGGSEEEGSSLSVV